MPFAQCALCSVAGGFASLAQELMDFKDQVPAPSISARALSYLEVMLAFWTHSNWTHLGGQAQGASYLWSAIIFTYVKNNVRIIADHKYEAP